MQLKVKMVNKSHKAIGIDDWLKDYRCDEDTWYAIGRLKINNACDTPDVDQTFWDDLKLTLDHVDHASVRLASYEKQVFLLELLITINKNKHDQHR